MLQTENVVLTEAVEVKLVNIFCSERDKIRNIVKL